MKKKILCITAIILIGCSLLYLYVLPTNIYSFEVDGVSLQKINVKNSETEFKDSDDFYLLVVNLKASTIRKQVLARKAFLDGIDEPINNIKILNEKTYIQLDSIKSFKNNPKSDLPDVECIILGKNKPVEKMRCKIITDLKDVSEIINVIDVNLGYYKFNTEKGISYFPAIIRTKDKVSSKTIVSVETSSKIYKSCVNNNPINVKLQKLH